MAENYVVNYDINVRAQQGLESIRKFQEATLKLDECGRKLLSFQKKIESVSAKFSQMAKRAPVFDISTSKANKKLDSVIVKLEKIHRLAKKVAALNVSAGATAGGRGGRQPSATPATIPARNPSATRKGIVPKNIGYRNFGPTMIDSGGIGAFDMVKGMGIAYGLSGLGSLMGSVIRESTEYDNIMKTTKNILGTHDKMPGFDRRFQEMAQTVRDVGVETKFTSQQVADASKFLAMAGFDLDAINKSIRPISDISLVGDTDLGETADVVTNIMTGYDIHPDKVRKAADVMTMTFTKTNTTLMDLAEAYKYSASLLSAAGISFEESTSGLGILGDAGIKGSQAGTTMRTIVANVVNPTKKQLSHWEEIGVERMDKKGNIRPLADIFQDLNKKKLHVADYYKIFHKTAAQGAVSLANNVDKWNEVIYKNFLSDGLVAKLAEEKKNTVQGLWYQLTSAFTENGLKVFEESQDSIRNLLKQTISWLESPEALKTIRDLSKCLLDLIVMLKDFGIWCVKMYNSMSWFIQPWLKFQVVMWPVLAFFRAFKALGNFGMYIVAIVASMTRLSGAIMGVFDAIKLIKQVGIISTLKSLFVGVASTARANTAGAIAGAVGVPTVQPFTVIRGGGGDPSNVVNATSSGGRFLSVLPWLGAAAAVGAFGYAIYGTYSYLKDLSKAYDNWYEKVYATKGYLSEGLSPSERYLKLVYDKQLGVNEKVEEYIRLRREEMGLTSQSLSDLNGKSIGEAHQEIIDKLNSSPWYSFINSGMKKAAAWESGREALMHLPKEIRKQYDYGSWSGPYGSSNNDIIRNGKSYSKDKFIRDMFASTIGYDYPETKDIIEEFTDAFKKAPIEEWDVIKTRLKNRLADYESKINPSYGDLSLDEMLKLDSSKTLSIPLAFQAFYNRVMESFDFLGGNENAMQLKALLDIHKHNGNLSDAQQANFFAANGLGYFAPILYGQRESDKRFGVDNKSGAFLEYGKYNAQDWERESFLNTNKKLDLLAEIVKNGEPDKKKNENYAPFMYSPLVTIDQLNAKTGFDAAKGAFVEYGKYGAQDWAKEYYSTVVSRMVEILNSLGKDVRDRFTLQSSPMAVAAWQQMQINEEEPQIGTKQWVNGKQSEYRFNAVTGKNEWVPLVNQPTFGVNGDNGKIVPPGTTGADQSNYKSHYKSGSAAPKQIIVKIENLMNVKSIDLTNPDNAAVIENIKGQLTQALVDVVHDFDDTFHS